jgi:hypothetical protein
MNETFNLEELRTLWEDARPVRATWANEIEQASDKVKLGVTPGRKRTEDEKWWRKQWYRSLMRDRKVGMRFSRSRIPVARL